MRTVNLNIISRYRTELMGLCAIFILLCHAPGNNVIMPSALSSILSLGGLGVDVFFVSIRFGALVFIR